MSNRGDILDVEQPGGDIVEQPAAAAEHRNIVVHRDLVPPSHRNFRSSRRDSRKFLGIIPVTALVTTWTSVGHAFLTYKGEDAFAYSRREVMDQVLLLITIADGHGGKVAAAHIVNHVFDYFVEALGDKVDQFSLEKACALVFARLHTDVLQGGSTSGAATTLCVINETSGILVCASVGDVFAILLPEGVHHGCKVVQISANHRLADNPDERRRVVDCGGTLGQVSVLFREGCFGKTHEIPHFHSVL